MPYVVTDLCNGCRYTECVSVCPVECFHIDDTMTYIDPTNCIDCGGCVPRYSAILGISGTFKPRLPFRSCVICGCAIPR